MDEVGQPLPGGLVFGLVKSWAAGRDPAFGRNGMVGLQPPRMTDVDRAFVEIAAGAGAPAVATA